MATLCLGGEIGVASADFVNKTTSADDTKELCKRRPYLLGMVNGQRVKFLVDSGASVTVVADTLMRNNRLQWEQTRLPLPSALRITGITGNTINLVDYLEAEVKVLGRTMTRPVIVVSGLAPDLMGILGYDFIKDEGLVIDGQENRCYFKRVLEGQTDWEIATLVVKQRQTVKDRGYAAVQCVASLNDSGTDFVGAQMGIVSVLPGSIFGLPDGLGMTREDGTISLTVNNVTDRKIVLPAGATIGFYRNPNAHNETIRELDDEVVNSIFGSMGHEPAEPKRGRVVPISKEEETTLRARLQIKADPPMRQVYEDLLVDYHDVLSKNKFDIGHTDVIQHVIRMKDEVPVHNKQFRIPVNHQECINNHVDELLKKGAIEISRSPYNSPIFAVTKKLPPNAPPGTPPPLRCVLDYRAVNAKSIPDRYSIREIRECIDEIGKNESKIFTTIDLTAGFWQQALEEESRQFTTFSVPSRSGRYQWCVTPMGLQGSPASFARLMDHVMRGILQALTYIDDVLAHNKTHEEHLKTLEEVFLRLRKYGLKVNVDKTIVASKEAQYLGYTISGMGVTLSSDKLAAVRDTKPPSTVRHIREFVGLAN